MAGRARGRQHGEARGREKKARLQPPVGYLKKRKKGEV